MGDLVHIPKTDEISLNNEPAEAETPLSRAVVPTVDIYTARVFFNITRKIVEETVDRRVSLLEKNIKERDREIMRTMRKMQARLVMQQNKAAQPWWRKLFKRGN